MDRAFIFRKLAEQWLRIAEEAINPSLRRCYTGKASRYRALAALCEAQRNKKALPKGSARPAGRQFH